MKLQQLQSIAKRINEFDFISRARRVENNTIELSFDKKHTYLFDMTRGHSVVYKTGSKRPIQGYNAPFDTLLHTLLASSHLLSVSVLEEDRVLRFELAPKSSYKDQKIYLQLEFTGKNTNAILVDENDTVIEALRHIDSDSSFRVVRPGMELLAIPKNLSKVQSPDNVKFDKKATVEPYESKDIDTWLEKKFEDMQRHKLQQIKKQKISTVRKKAKKLTELLRKLPDEKSLEKSEKLYAEQGNLILANLYQIKPYDTKLKTYAFDGNEVTINLPKGIKVNRISDYFFNLSKRAKNKVKNIHIEKENLESKRDFYENIIHSLEQSNDIYELELLAPKKARSKRKKERLRDGELFWIEDYKVMVGRNSNENQKLLQLAKANDIWMHIQGIPSSHVIIRTDKQNLAESIIKSAAKLCVDFSIKNPGDYNVDYTKRKFVRVQEGSNVLYNKYDTIIVTKEGVEIRD